MLEHLLTRISFLNYKAVAMCGCLAGLTIALIPIIITLANGLIGWVSWTLGGDGNSVLGADTLMRHLSTISKYLANGKLLLLLLVAICTAQAVINRYLIIKGRYFPLNVSIAGASAVLQITWDVPIVIFCSPLLLYLTLPSIGIGLMQSSGVLVLMSFVGGIYYCLWDATYSFYVMRVGSIDKIAYTTAIINNLFKESDSLRSCQLSCVYSSDGIVRVMGAVADWQQLSAVRSCASRAVGVVDVDMSGVRVDPSLN